MLMSARFFPRGKVAGPDSIRVYVGLRSGLYALENRKSLTLTGRNHDNSDVQPQAWSVYYYSLSAAYL